MVETAYPFDTGPGANVLETEWQRMARLWLSTGVAPTSKGGRAGHLAVSANGGAMQVTVAAGTAWVEGFLYDSDAAKNLPIGAADATNPRIDTVVVRLDRGANTATTLVLQGAPAASPTAPALSQTDLLYDLPLADVRVNAAVGVINAGDVTDRRVQAQGARGPLVLFSDTTEGVGLSLVSRAGNTAPLLEGWNPSGVVAFRVDATGNVLGRDLRGSHIYAQVAGGATAYMGARLNITGAAADERGAVIRLAPAQTANAVEVQASDGALLTRITSDGSVLGGANNIIAAGGLGFVGGRLNSTAGSGLAGLVVRQAAGSADLLALFQRSDGRNMVYVEGGGRFVANYLSAAADFGQNQLEIRDDNGRPGIAFHIPGVAAAQFKMLSNGTFSCVNNPGTALTDLRAQNLLARWVGVDDNGGQTYLTYMRAFPGDFNQVSFQSDPAGDTGYRTLRAGGYATVSKGDTKTDVVPVDMTAGAVSQGAKVRLLKATTTRPLNDRLRDLVPVAYKRKRGPDTPADDPATHADPTLYSFVAEDAARVVPEVVAFDAKGAPTGIDVGAVAVLTLAAVQALMDRVTALENPPAPQPAPAPAAP